MGLEPLRVRSLDPTLCPKARANMIGLGLWWSFRWGGYFIQ